MTPAEIYKSAKAECERLQKTAASTSDWVRFANDVLEYVMTSQGVVMEKQKAVREALREGTNLDGLAVLRSEAKDALFYVDQLTALYQRAKEHLS